jgi:ribosomal protein S18 acetylase RimI-like enzyme
MAVTALEMMRMVKPEALSLRPITPDDEAFLMELYASARTDVQAWISGDKEKAVFLEMQYRVQDQYFRSQHPGADYSLIQSGKRNIGRLYTAKTDREIRVLDITLLPEYRNRGIGGSVISGTLEEAKNAHLPVRLMVERFNQARTLYERMGFQIIEDAGTHYHMEWAA